MTEIFRVTREIIFCIPYRELQEQSIKPERTGGVMVFTLRAASAPEIVEDEKTEGPETEKSEGASGA